MNVMNVMNVWALEEGKPVMNRPKTPPYNVRNSSQSSHSSHFQGTLDYWFYESPKLNARLTLIKEKPSKLNPSTSIPAFRLGISCKDHPSLIYCNPISWRSHFLETHLLGFPEEEQS